MTGPTRVPPPPKGTRIRDAHHAAELWYRGAETGFELRYFTHRRIAEIVVDGLVLARSPNPIATIEWQTGRPFKLRAIRPDRPALRLEVRPGQSAQARAELASYLAE